MFDAAMLWIELQYHLGYCQPYISDADFLYWREWWKDSPLDQTDMGRRLLLLGDKQFNDGIRDRGSKQPSAELCQRTVNSWFEEMKAAVKK